MKNPFNTVDKSITTLIACLSTIIALAWWISEMHLDNKPWAIVFITIDHILMLMSLASLVQTARYEEPMDQEDENLVTDASKIKDLSSSAIRATIIPLTKDGLGKERSYDLKDPDQKSRFDQDLKDMQNSEGEPEKECDCPGCQLDRIMRDSAGLSGNQIFDKVVKEFEKDPLITNQVKALKHFRRIELAFVQQVKQWVLKTNDIDDRVRKMMDVSCHYDKVMGVISFGVKGDEFIIDELSTMDAAEVHLGLKGFNEVAIIVARRTLARSIMDRAMGRIEPVAQEERPADEGRSGVKE